MKVALVYDLIYPHSKGGVEKRVAQLARGLAARGADVHVVGTKHWEGPDVLERDGVTIHGLRSPHRLTTRSGRRSIWQGALFALAVARWLARRDFDVIDTQSMAPLASLAAVIVGRFKKTPVLTTWHEVWGPYWREYVGVVGVVGEVIEKLNARMGAHHAAVSTTTAVRLEGLGVEEVALVPNGVWMTEKSAPLPDRSNRIVYVGRLAGHKNLELLVDAVRALHDEGVEAEALVIGVGPSREHLERYAAGVEGCRFAGRVESDEEVARLVRSSRVFALPSLREGFGISALEALASGVPVVTVDHPDNATRELVTSEVDGLVVPAEPKAYADALKRVLTDDDLHERLSRGALATAAPYSMERVLDRVAEVYSELVPDGKLTGGHGTEPVASSDGGRGRR